MARIIRDNRNQKSKGFGFVSVLDGTDCVKAITEMNGKYCGNRPMKLKKSSWKDRNKGVIKAKMRKNKKSTSWGFA
jgi:RNA recognition motif-containing protein